MEFFAIIFQSLSALLAFLAAAILLFVNKEQLHSNRLLAMVLLIFALINLNSVFIYKAWFLHFPYLHKFVLPITLLVIPASWLYVKSVLRGELKNSKTDWLIIIPSMLCLIDLLPYYTMPLAEKKAYLEEFFKQPYMQARFSEGILPPYVFSFIRVVWSAAFISLSFKMISQFKKAESKPVLLNNDALIKWLSLFNWLLAGVVTVALLNAIIAPVFKTNIVYLDLVAGISVLTICLRLFTQPRLLYGIFQPSQLNVIVNDLGQDATDSFDFAAIEQPASQANNIDDVIQLQPNEKTLSELFISGADTIRYKKIVETLFQQQHSFLKTDYSLEQLVKETNIPRYILSAFINREYGMGFREYINRHRVDFFKENLSNPGWKNLTLEAIASDCGFSSRSTFINNFKQITGQTPSEFIKKNNLKSIADSI
jgi:AraC-like DNA-binding protein